jgi:hypothetical protein
LFRDGRHLRSRSDRRGVDGAPATGRTAADTGPRGTTCIPIRFLFASAAAAVRCVRARSGCNRQPEIRLPWAAPIRPSRGAQRPPAVAVRPWEHRRRGARPEPVGERRSAARTVRKWEKRGLKLPSCHSLARDGGRARFRS